MAQTVFAQQKEAFTDPRDGKMYQTVKIGSQNWMAQNLDYHGKDGNLGLCYGDVKRKKKSKICPKKYGKLYNWDDANKACPIGWHLPDSMEWRELIDFAGGYKVAGTKLKTDEGWGVDLLHCKGGEYVTVSKYKTAEIDSRGKVMHKKLEYCSNGTDDFGFAALPGGGGNSDGFIGAGYVGSWWSATLYGFVDDYAYYLSMDYRVYDVLKQAHENSVLFSVRCVQDVYQ